MKLKRRDVLAAAAGAAGLPGCGEGRQDRRAPEEPTEPAPPAGPSPSSSPARPASISDWSELRGLFALREGLIDMSAMLLASHPAPVREAIARHADALDADPAGYLNREGDRLTEAARAAAGAYLGADGEMIALTDSTTMGVGLIYSGLRLSPDDEILTTHQDYFVTHEAVRVACERTGAEEKRIDLFDTIESADPDEMVERIAGAITPATRALALTWVHSSTGLKIPAASIAEAVAGANAGRAPEERVLFCLDAVHGFGVENETFDSLGCDFLMAGCHKWLFGPRGTGIVAGRAWDRLSPTVPSFIDDEVFLAWLEGREPRGPAGAARLTPGGFKAFEHRWATTEAFGLHERLGKARVAERTHALAAQLKEGLAGVDAARLVTPRDSALSSGVVSFDLDGRSPESVVENLRARDIVASVAPYDERHVRLTPSIRNTPEEIEAVLAVLRALA